VEGENLREIDAALERAKADPRPSLIIARTHIAFGAPHKQDTPEAHGAPLGAEELRLTKRAFGRDPQAAFVVPPPVAAHLAAAVQRGAALEADWNRRLEQALDRGCPALAAWRRAETGELPVGWEAALPRFSAADRPLATRAASGRVLNALAEKIPLLLGGSADLAPSNNTRLKGAGSFAPGISGRNIHFGVREHAMAAILNGLAHTPGLVPYAGTFLVFSDYMRPPMRLAAMMGLAPVYVLTHDSIGLGEDGPTHQPVEHLAALRAIPNLTVIRPCDAEETVQAWRAALANRSGPTALVLTRQKLPVLDRANLGAADGLLRGGYVLAREQGALAALLIASGSEVHAALGARRMLQQDGLGVRVVSLPCWELFDAQPEAYRRQVLPDSCSVRLAVEAGVPQGWARYVGERGAIQGMHGFGASAPGDRLLEHFGFTASQVAERLRTLL
jgi:transketolase